MSKLGECKINKRGELISVVGYRHYNDIDVLFSDYDYIVKNTRYPYFKQEKVRSPYSRTVYGVGYLGEDFYKYKNIRNLKAYQYWRNMLKRCYCEKALNVGRCYENVKVCDEWLNFSNYYEWFSGEYYEIEGERMTVDKDIKNKHALEYSPENCIIVPMRINSLFENNKSKDNSTCKYIGVEWIKADKIYGSHCRNGNGESVWLGRSKDPIECFNRYKNYKEFIIQQVADEYQNKIPQKVYEIMYSYKVEITD